jgi:hypothetical protein
MFRSWYRSFAKRPFRQTSRGPRPRARLQVEALEDRQLLAGSIGITALALPGFASGTAQPLAVATEGQAGTTTLMATFFDAKKFVQASDLTATIDYGDGTPLAKATIVDQGGGQFQITDSHTFPEESGSQVPPFSFKVTLRVSENATASNTTTQTGQAQVLDAALSPGDPVNGANSSGPMVGGDVGDTTTAAQALANFENAIGGPKNTAPSPQQGGFRTITWDGVKVDGTDSVAGPNSTTVITPGHTVGIPLDRFQGQGVFFSQVYAVSNDGFVDVNNTVGGLFPAFSPSNIFAMFNDNGIDFKFVAPSAPNTAPVSAASRGFGAVFENVEQPGTTIQYFNGSTLLDTVKVPVGGQGSQVFAGELFNQPIVTNVLLTLGNGVIFKFDGKTVTQGDTNDVGTNLVTVDDWAFAEPVPITNGFPITSGPVGTTGAPAIATTVAGRVFNGEVARFSDADPLAVATDFTATINWGDGHLTNGQITSDGSGGFSVSGTNTYATPGQFPVSVDIFDFGGGPGVGGSQPSLAVSNTIKVLDANHGFVRALYNDFLGREGSQTELDAWVSALPALGQAGVANGISHSPEALTHAVDGLYAQLLGRDAHGGEEQGFVHLLEQGATLERVSALILSSPEFAARANRIAGGTNADSNYIQGLYLFLLGRQPSLAEINAFVGVLPKLGRAGVALEFEESAEFRNDVVRGLYGVFLDRLAPPSAAEIAPWVNSGLDLLSLETALASSGEYFQNG